MRLFDNILLPRATARCTAQFVLISYFTWSVRRFHDSAYLRIRYNTRMTRVYNGFTTVCCSPRRRINKFRRTVIIHVNAFGSAVAHSPIRSLRKRFESPTLYNVTAFYAWTRTLRSKLQTINPRLETWFTRVPLVRYSNLSRTSSARRISVQPLLRDRASRVLTTTTHGNTRT